MQGFALLVLCVLLPAVVTVSLFNKHTSKHKFGKDTTVRKRIRAELVPVKGNHDAFKFLTRFGYNRCDNPVGSKLKKYGSPSCQSSIESMLKEFQTAYRLPVTKKLDTATLKLMNTPRCSLPDSPLPLIDKSKLWPKNRTLKWKLDRDHFVYEPTKTHQSIQEAFDDWADDSGLTFREVASNEKADFNLAFVYGDHGDGSPLDDGPGGVLAHAFYPWAPYRGQIHFDSAEEWSNTYDNVGINLRLVTSHEIGHSLGLEHTLDLDSIMYPTYRLILRKDILSEKDRTDIQALYEEEQPEVTTSSSSTSFKTTTAIRTTTIAAKGTPPYPARWTANGITVAGGHGDGAKTYQLNLPHGLFIDEDQTMYIADIWNHRIVAWKTGAAIGAVVAGGKGKGNRLDQLNDPSDVTMDRDTNNLLICDRANRRVMRWACCLSSTASTFSVGEIVVDNIDCCGLTMDHQGYLYVGDMVKHEVKRYGKEDKDGTVVAGGHGIGVGLHQLNRPTYLFVDKDSTLYVSDHLNYRVMKWVKGATEGIVVAGGQGQGTSLAHLSHTAGVWVDGWNHLYVVDQGNARVMRWNKGAKVGTVIVGGNGHGAGANQLSQPIGISFDRHGHLYVADFFNHRVQRFAINTN